MVVIGVDAHKRTHTASAVQEATGRAQGDVTVSADGDGHLRLLDFARGHGEHRIWAVEDCRHVSGALERFLLGAENALRARPKDEEALKDEQIKKLKQKIGDLVLDNDILKEAAKDRPFGSGTSDE